MRRTSHARSALVRPSPHPVGGFLHYALRRSGRSGSPYRAVVVNRRWSRSGTPVKRMVDSHDSPLPSLLPSPFFAVRSSGTPVPSQPYHIPYCGKDAKANQQRPVWRPVSTGGRGCRLSLDDWAVRVRHAHGPHPATPAYGTKVSAG